MDAYIYTPKLPINKNKITVEFTSLQHAYLEKFIIEMQVSWLNISTDLLIDKEINSW